MWDCDRLKAAARRQRLPGTAHSPSVREPLSYSVRCTLSRVLASAHSLTEIRICKIVGCPNEATGRASFTGLCDFHKHAEARRRQANAKPRAPRARVDDHRLVALARETLDATRKLAKSEAAVLQAEKRRAQAAADWRRAMGLLLVEGRAFIGDPR